MTNFIVLLGALSLAVPVAAANEPPSSLRYESISQPPEAGPAARTDDVRFADDGYERMTVPVRLAGSGPYRFLVDTGSDRTSISRELAGRLGLAEGPGASLHSATGRSDVRMAIVPELTLSRKTVRHIAAPLLDAADIGADGILGIDTLRSHRVLFDFGSRTLSISSAQKPAAVDDKDAIVVRARRRHGRLVITDAEAAGQAMSVVLDTGSQLSIGNEALRRKLERRGAIRSIGSFELVSVTGAILRGELAVIRQLDIGGVTLERLAVVFADAHTFRQLSLDKGPAMLLGMNALRSFDKVSIDFDSRKIRFVVPKSSGSNRLARRNVSP